MLLFSHVSSLERGVESQSPGRLWFPQAFLLREGVVFGACRCGAITPESQLTGQKRWSWELPRAVDAQMMFPRVRVLREPLWLWARARRRAVITVLGFFSRVFNAVQVQMWTPQTAVRIQHTLRPGFCCFCWRRAFDLTHGNHLH